MADGSPRRRQRRGCVGTGVIFSAVNVHGHADGLLVDELLAQDACVPAVLSELAQDVEVHPAQRERAAPVAVDHVV